MRIIREHVPRFERSIRVRRFAESAFDAPLHVHPETELTWIVRGSGTRYVGDSAAAYAAGDVALVGSETPHQWVSEDTPATRQGPAEALIFHFDWNFLGEEAWQAPELADAAELRKRARGGLAIEGEIHARTCRAMLAIEAATPTRRLPLLLALLVDLGESRMNLRPLSSPVYAAAPLDAAGDPRLQAVLRLISERRHQRLTVSQAAKAASLSPSAFCRWFRSLTGRTFVEALNEERIRAACELLATTNRQISDIAPSCGFRNQGHFNGVFRQRLGETPGSYRRRNRK